jgi:hypothetical protein
MEFIDIAKKLGCTEQSVRRDFRSGMIKIRVYLQKNSELAAELYLLLNPKEPLSGKRIEQLLDSGVENY